MTDTKQQSQLVSQLLDPALAESIFPHPVQQLQLIETHISWVVLTGHYVYKIKKSVDFGFLDFSSLEKRKYFCEQELRINRRYAAALYLDIVAITGSLVRPKIINAIDAIVDSSDEVLEYAVKMQEFSQHCLLHYCLQHKQITRTHIDSLAKQLATFHAVAACSETTNQGEAGYGSYVSVSAPIQENFRQIRLLDDLYDSDQQLHHLQAWSENELLRLLAVIEQRKRDGFIRECHGDLHLGNIALIDDQVTFFDGIEFNDQLRWIDTQSELAYLLMDLEDKGYLEWSSLIRNQYLEYTGDYRGTSLLRFYQVYRALVRVKVNGLRLAQQDIAEDERDRCQSMFQHYLSVAERYTATPSPFLAITHGVSGSGKTTLSNAVVEQCQAIRIRSDVERKRLHGLQATSDSHSQANQGIYTPAATQRTFDYLADTAAALIGDGYSVIIDATFLAQSLRDRFYALAQAQHVPFVILHCTAEEATLIERLQQRAALKLQAQDSGHASAVDASEADIGILNAQLAVQEPLTDQEKRLTFELSGQQAFQKKQLLDFIDRQQ